MIGLMRIELLCIERWIRYLIPPFCFKPYHQNLVEFFLRCFKIF